MKLNVRADEYLYSSAPPIKTSNKSDRVIALRLSTPLVYRKY